ncbi:unnamed protein product, partial [Laminaria digitata]
ERRVFVFYFDDLVADLLLLDGWYVFFLVFCPSVQQYECCLSSPAPVRPSLLRLVYVRNVGLAGAVLSTRGCWFFASDDSIEF